LNASSLNFTPPEEAKLGWSSAALELGRGMSLSKFCVSADSRLVGITSPGNRVRVAGGPDAGSKIG
jgi:hypothetical protein